MKPGTNQHVKKAQSQAVQQTITGNLLFIEAVVYGSLLAMLLFIPAWQNCVYFDLGRTLNNLAVTKLVLFARVSLLA